MTPGEHPDLDRPIDLEAGRLYYAYGGGAFRLVPRRCRVGRTPGGSLDFQLDLARGLTAEQSSASLSIGLGPHYDVDAALAKAREHQPASTVLACVLTDWWFRLLPSPGLRVPPEFGEPLLMPSDALGSARLATPLSLDSGLLIETMLQEQTGLAGLAEAEFAGVSPRLPVVVEFAAHDVLDALLAAADTTSALPREAIRGYFAQALDNLPVSVGGSLDERTGASFPEAMADRLIARFGHFVPAVDPADVPVVRLTRPAENAAMRWSLSQPFLAKRRLPLTVDLLAQAQAQVRAVGLDSAVTRRDTATLSTFGKTRVRVLANLPYAAEGVDALGVTLTFPPCPPARPQARVATALFDSASDMAVIELGLSPGEPARYRYSAFAVVSDDAGTRQLDAEEREWQGSPLRLSTEHFPIDFAAVSVTPALQALAVVTGTCACEDQDGQVHVRAFTLDNGRSSFAMAIPRERQSVRIEGLAVARDGKGEVRVGPFESPQVQLDLSVFSGYGPQQALLRMVFDDSAPQRIVECEPLVPGEGGYRKALLFTPAAATRTYAWFSPSPFLTGFRYRGTGRGDGAWTQAAVESGQLVLYSSQLEAGGPAQEVAAKSGPAVRESRVVRPTRTLESGGDNAPVPEATPEPVAASPEANPSDELLYDQLGERPAKLYVPRYVLDEQTVSGQPRYRLAFGQSDGVAWLEINLAVTMAPAVFAANPDAEEYPHGVSIQLEYLVAPPAGAKKILDFDEVSRSAGIVTARVRFATLAERDAVYRALTEAAQQCRLTVRRFIDVSVPYDPAPPPDGGYTLPLRPLSFSAMAKLVALPAPAAGPGVSAIGTASAMTLRGQPFVLAARGIESLAKRREAGSVLRRTVALNKPAILVRDQPLVRIPVDRFVNRLPAPTLVFNGASDEAGQRKLRFGIANWADFADDFFSPSPDLPPGGANPAAARTWVELHDADNGQQLYSFTAISSAQQLAELTFALEGTRSMPAQVNAVMIDRRAKTQQTSNTVDVAAPAEPADHRPRRPVRQELKQAVLPEPFVFSPVLHGYVFQGLTPGTGGSSQLVRYRIPWLGRFHTYLQDASRPSLVYFFADRFRLARRPDAPYTPFATVRVRSHSDGAGADVVVDYVIAPHTDSKRLEQARAVLLADPRFGAETIDFQPFITSDVRFFVDRPAESGAIREERSGAGLVLQSALKDTLAMTLGDFRLLFDAMHKRTASLFLGRVEVGVPGEDAEAIPFTARLDDLEGEVFSYAATARSDAGISVVLTNQIESPVSVQTLDGMLIHGSERIPVRVESGDVPHTSLLPGASLQVTVAPTSPLPPDAQPQLTFDLSGVEVLLDVERAWDSILDRSTLDYYRMITAKAIASYFVPVSGREDEQIVSILVEFEGGGTGELNAEQLETRVRVDYPIDDIVLGRPAATDYRYSVTVVRANGTQDSDSEPRSGSGQVFFVSVTR